METQEINDNILSELIQFFRNYEDFEELRRRFNVSELHEYFPQYTEVQLSDYLGVLIRRNRFIKEEISGEIKYYYLRLTDNVRSFMKTLSINSLKFISDADLDIYSNELDITEIEKTLSVNSFSISDLVKLFNKNLSTKIAPNSIRQYISNLKSLGFLKQTEFETYFIDLRNLLYFNDFKTHFEAEKFWNAIIRFKGLNSIEIHDIKWHTIEKLNGKTNKLLEENGWFVHGNSWIKTINTIFGEFTITAYSSENQLQRNYRIDFKGTIKLKNRNNRNENYKFSVSVNKINEMNLIIQQELYKLRINSEIGFNHNDFLTKFKISNIAFNIDTEEEKIKDLGYEFPKELLHRDFTNHFTVRFYKYFDKLANQNILRTEIHPDRADDNTSESIIKLMSGTGNIVKQTKQSLDISEKIEKLNQFNEQIIRDQGRMTNRVGHSVNKLTNGFISLNTSMAESTSILSNRIDSIKNDFNSAFEEISQIQSEDSTQVQVMIQKISESMNSEFEQITETINSHKSRISEEYQEKILQTKQELNLFLKEFGDKIEDSVNILTDNMNLIQTSIKKQSETNKILENIVQNHENKLDVLIRVAEQNSEIIKRNNTPFSTKIKNFFRKEEKK